MHVKDVSIHAVRKNENILQFVSNVQIRELFGYLKSKTLSKARRNRGIVKTKMYYALSKISVSVLTSSKISDVFPKFVLFVLAVS